MDSELKSYLDKMQGSLETSLSSGIRNVEKRIQENADTSLASHEATRKQVSAIGKQVGVLGQQVGVLWREVKGSDPPPTGGAAIAVEVPFGVPMDEKISSHDLSIAGLEGQLISVDSRLNSVKEEMATKAEVQTCLETINTVREMTQKQMDVAGIKTKPEERSLITRTFDLFAWMMKEREGQKFALAALAALTGLLTAFGTSYALVTGRLPLPSSAVPVVQQPYAREPAPPPPHETAPRRPGVPETAP